jgi:hypothetical protein
LLAAGRLNAKPVWAKHSRQPHNPDATAPYLPIPRLVPRQLSFAPPPYEKRNNSNLDQRSCRNACGSHQQRRNPNSDANPNSDRNPNGDANHPADAEPNSVAKPNSDAKHVGDANAGTLVGNPNPYGDATKGGDADSDGDPDAIPDGDDSVYAESLLSAVE